MTMSLIGRRLGNYDIQSQIGEGGMGAVYLGMHPSIGKRVAIKVLHEELASKADVVQRFFNEAKAVNDISHPNIVDIIDFGETTFDGSSFKYIIMEFLDGESLASRMRREGVTIRESITVLMQCASALAASHSKGVIHRDLKPENIFLCNRPGDRNYVKLLDFGIAKLTSDSGAALSQKTRTGMVIGTPTYMSPEQCDGKGQIDARADIYALGVMMFELLTGRVPFPGEGFGEVLVAHLTREPDAPRSINPNIPPEIEAIILRCLKKRKEDRFQSMNDMLAALSDPGPHYQAWLAGRPAPVMTGAVNIPTPPPTGAMPMMQNPMGTGAMQAVGMPGQAGRSPSAVWAVVNPNMPPQMQQQMMQQQMMQQQMMQQQMQMMPPMQSGAQQMMPMPPGASPMPTGMMMAPGMGSGMTPALGGDMMPIPGAIAGPRPTTLSGASAEQSGRRRPLNVLIGFVGAVVIGALVIITAKLVGKDRTPAVTPPKDAMVSILLKTDPPDAEVMRSDELDEVGKTPYKFQVKKGSKPIDIKVRLSGYKEETRTINAGEDQTLEINLAKEASSEPAAPVDTGSKPKKGKPPKEPPATDTKPAKAKEPAADVDAKPAKSKEKPAPDVDAKPAKTKEKPAADADAKPAKGKEKPAADADAKPAKGKGKGKGKDKDNGDGILTPVF
ncbi:MAG TPA: serine/threonine-protein kinase [Pseudomonadota bacterium]|nr:serine/threonine-protein kinase [Pseudomonadota bacterium]